MTSHSTGTVGEFTLLAPSSAIGSCKACASKMTLRILTLLVESCPLGEFGLQKTDLMAVVLEAFYRRHEKSYGNSVGDNPPASQKPWLVGSLPFMCSFGTPQLSFNEPESHARTSCPHASNKQHAPKES